MKIGLNCREKQNRRFQSYIFFSYYPNVVLYFMCSHGFIHIYLIYMDAIFIYMNISPLPLLTRIMLYTVSSQISWLSLSHSLITCHKTDLVWYFIFLTLTPSHSLLPVSLSLSHNNTIFISFLATCTNTNVPKLCSLQQSNFLHTDIRLRFACKYEISINILKQCLFKQ